MSFCTDSAVKESVYQQIFEFRSEDNATQISIADQQSESDTRTCSTVTDTVTDFFIILFSCYWF